MYWPTPQDYNEAIQTPQISFKDAELKESMPELSTLGLPRPNTGAFASVYRVTSHGRDWAVRCFLRNVAGQHERYAELSKFIMADDLVYTVGFEYLEEGIKIKGNWYPILKMEWVDGVSLDQYIRKHLHDQDAIKKLLDLFLHMTDRLTEAGMAHGDLQHGNIMVLDDDLRLVDYDGMFVPALAGQKSTELGHPNYQHPDRSSNHFGPNLDCFSERVICTALTSLVIDPSLWHKLAGGDECLLFRRADFSSPETSLAFSVLEYHAHSDVRHAARNLRAMLRNPPDQIPFVRESVTVPDDLPELAEPGKLIITAPVISRKLIYEQSSKLPDWMQEGEIDSNGQVRKPHPKKTAPWPRSEHYNQAILNPACFDDPELRSGVTIFEDRRYGTQSVVFHVRSFGRHIAVKCFFNEQTDRSMRYGEIQKYFSYAGSPPSKGPVRKYFTDFEYIEEGIQVKGYWYPVVKMDWVFGMTLDEYILKNKDNRQRLDALAERFREMMKTLGEAGIAHGDLEPSNIMLVHDDFKLVDYDNVFVPSMAGMISTGCGHPGYQHPGRRLSHFGSGLDNFSAQVIHAQLRFLSINPNLWEIVDSRLKSRSAKPSLAFQWLDVHLHPEVRNTARLLSSLLETDAGAIPPIDYQQYAKANSQSAGWSRLFKKGQSNP